MSPAERTRITTSHAGRPSSAIALATFFAVIALTGCGGSGSQQQASASTAGKTSTSTAASQSSTIPFGERPKSPPMELSSPAISSVGEFPLIPARYTCDGANTPPPLRWHNIPFGTRELVLLLLSVDRARHGYRLDWAVAGLKPELHGLPAGRLPAGAIVGRNASGQTRYSLCPPKGMRQASIFALFALPYYIGLKPGFQEKTLTRHNHGSIEEAALRFSYKR
jgi:hypothetical protein